MTERDIELDVQVNGDFEGIPTADQMRRWVDLTLSHQGFESNPELPIEMTVRIVGAEESQQLNAQYRDKNKPTNVLSFAYEGLDQIPLALLGDLVICAPIVLQEALEQNKPLSAHWAHLVIHGTLHLLGHDHIDDIEAEIMEALEVEILAQLGFPDPYAISS